MSAAFAQIALGFSKAMGGPYYDAAVITASDAVYDDGGSIVTPGKRLERPCQAQGDAVSEAMRLEPGYADKDIRLVVLSPTLDGGLDTDALVRISGGPHIGLWSVQSVTRDPIGIAYVCRGRRA